MSRGSTLVKNDSEVGMIPKESKPPAKHKWSSKQMKAIELLSDPTDSRPQYEIAHLLKIKPPTLSVWKSLPGFMDEVVKRLDAKKTYVKPNIWKQAYLHGCGRSYQDRRLLMEAVGDIKSTNPNVAAVQVNLTWGKDSPDDSDDD